MQKKWWQEAVVYELYCRSFCDSNGDGIGDLRGVISKLPVLKELGVNCIWFTPIYRSPQVDNGYDISDYRAIDPIYGTMADFDELLETAHGMGIRIIMDMVLCHTSDEHPWFQESRKSKDNPYRDYYVWRAPKDGKEPNNWANFFNEGRGSAWEYDELTGEYYLHHYSRKMPDVNWECPALRQEMYGMMRWWLDKGVDGFRLDVINRMLKPAGLPDSTLEPSTPAGRYGYVLDRAMCSNVEGIHELLREISANTWGRYDAMTVGEMGSLTSDGALDYIAQDAHEVDMAFHFEIARKEHVATACEFKEIQRRWIGLMEHNAWITQYLSNHDSPRQVSHFGNDREYRVESAKLLATLLHTLPGTPFIYQGEEIGMTNVDYTRIEDYNDRYTVCRHSAMVEGGMSPEEALSALRAMSRDNGRSPYQWDDTPQAGFTSGKPWIPVNGNYREVNYAADRRSPDSVFAYYQKLTAMRKEHPAVVDGTFRLLLPEHPQMIVFLRTCARETLLTIANYSDRKAGVTIPDEVREHRWERILTNREDTAPSIEGRAEWLPWEAEVYALKR